MSLINYLIPNTTVEHKKVDPNPLQTAFYKRMNFRVATNNVLTSYAATNTSVVYTANNYAQIYGFPKPTVNRVFGVISLGGGLFGTVKNGILTSGDVKTYWSQLRIVNQPVVYIRTLDGARNVPSVNDGGATAENTLDVATIGACCPGSRNIIILYIAPPTFNGFYNAFNAAINGSVVVNRATVRPSIISCSWGAPEKWWTPSDLTRFNSLFAVAVSKGINITAATGDTGASNGLPGLNTDFPSSSPNVIACGGTTLVCPTRSYAGAGTRETTWPGTGGGISATFAKPAFQRSVPGTKRNTPDIAMNADPKTGVMFIVKGKTVVYGGTSIVSPAMAAYIGCLSVSAPGFVATKLYNNPTYFYDVIIGNNGGYSAKVGYDNCTGLGSINGSLLSVRL
jgi:kumamolisin